jgi:tetratricopeptide (TPR) repeat protein
MIMFMRVSRLSVKLVLVGLILWLAVACATSDPARDATRPAPGALLYTRTPVPAATPTPTLHPQFAYLQGLGQREAWHLEEAIARYTKSIELAPSATTYVSRAEAYRLTGEYAKAAADVESALEMSPESPDAWRQKVLLTRELGDWEQALEAVNRLIELVPDDGSAYVLRAQIYYEGLHRPQHALQDFDQAIALDPAYDKATLVERWNILAGLDRWEQALLVSHKIITTGSEDPLRYFYRGWSLIQVERIDEAIQKLHFGIQRYPDYPVMLYYALGVAYYERGAWPEAVQSLEVALAQFGAASEESSFEWPLDLTTADILAPLGVSYLGLRQCETGAAIVERAIAESPHPADWLWARDRIEACYIALTPTPTATPFGTPAP